MSNTTYLINEDIENRNKIIKSVNNYDIFFHLNRDNYSGRSIISLNLNEQILNQSKELEHLIIDFKGQNIHSVSIESKENNNNESNDNIIKHIHQNNKIILKLQDIIKIINNNLNDIKIKISFNNIYSIYKAEGIVHKHDNNGQDFIYCQGEVASTHSIFPCIDQINFKSTYTICVQTPIQWQVYSHSQSIMEDNVNDYEKITYFPCTDIAFPTYLFGLYAGDNMIQYKDKYYRNGDGDNDDKNKNDYVELNIYCRRQVKDQLDKEYKEYFNQIKFGLKYMEEYTKINYYLNKFDVFFCPYYTDQGMETLGCISLDEDYFFDADQDQQSNNNNELNEIYQNSIVLYDQIELIEILFHEIVHQWFGNYITIKWWNDLFIKEGFANFFSSKIIKEYLKQENIMFYPEIQCIQIIEQNLSKTNNNNSLIHKLQPYKKYVSMEYYDNITYEKSHQIFRLLENKLYGQEQFQNIIQNIFQEYKNKLFSHDDLLYYFNDKLTLKYLTSTGYEYFDGQDIKQLKINGNIDLDNNDIKELNLMFYKINKSSFEITKHQYSEIQINQDKDKDQFIYILNTCDNHLIQQSIDYPSLLFINQNNLMKQFDYQLRVSIWKSLLFISLQNKSSKKNNNNINNDLSLNQFFIQNILFEENDALFYLIIGEYYEVCNEFTFEEEFEFLGLLNQDNISFKKQILLIENLIEYLENIDLLLLIEQTYLIHFNHEQSNIKNIFKQKIQQRLNELNYNNN